MHALRNLSRLLVAACLLGLAAPASARIEATTEDGRRVLLDQDGTWEYADAAPAGEREAPLRLEVLSVSNQRHDCVIGLKLHNEADYLVVSLVPQFEALVTGNVPFDNAFVAFSDIKPTLSQYRELVFERLSCEDIERVRIHGGDRCTMDELDKFSRATGECLSRVRIVPSGRLELFK